MVWNAEFGTLAPVDNTKGALPYGFYSIEEMACDNNKNLGLIKFDFVVKQDKKSCKPWNSSRYSNEYSY